MSCCVKSAVRKPLFQTARFNLILRQEKLYKAAFSAPVFWERGHLPPFQKRPGPPSVLIQESGLGSRLQRRRNQSCFSRQEGLGSPSKRRSDPPRSPPKEGGGTLLVSPGRRASEAALFFSKGGPRNSPRFTSLPASFLPSRKGLFPRLPLPLVQKKTGEQPLAPDKDLLRPAGGQGRTKNTGPKQRVPFKGFPSGLRWFRTVPEECPDPVGKVFRPARGGVQAYPACGAYRRMKKETGESPVSFGFGWGGGTKCGDRAGLPFSFGSEALSPRRRSFGRPRRPPDRPPTTGRGGPR